MGGFWGEIIGVLALTLEFIDPIRFGLGSLGLGFASLLSVFKKLLRRFAPWSVLSDPEAGKPGSGGRAVLGLLERSFACRSVISWAERVRVSC